MASKKCDVCSNEYAGAFQVSRGNETFTFDSFECAIHKVAPACAHCRCKIIGHGVEAGGQLYCCSHCTRETGVSSDKGQRA